MEVQVGAEAELEVALDADAEVAEVGVWVVVVAWVVVAWAGGLGAVAGGDEVILDWTALWLSGL